MSPLERHTCTPGYNCKHLEPKKVFIKTFPGAKVDCMKHYAIPTLQQKPEMVLFWLFSKIPQKACTAGN